MFTVKQKTTMQKKELKQMTNEELDVLYLKTYGRLAWHMSREGYIHFLSNK